MYLIEQHVQLNNMLFRFLLAVVVVFSSISASIGQSSECENTLNQATQEFSVGHFYGIPSLLAPCLSKLTKEQSVKAYLLLTQVYLVIDDPIAAEGSYLKLLRADPEYIATEEKDPIDLVYLSKGFTTRPIITPRVFVGLNASIARTIASVNSDPVPIVAKQSLGVGIQFGGGLDWNIDDHFSFCVDFSFNTKAFKSIRNGISVRDEQSLTESQTWLDVPLYLRYSRKFGKFDPYLYAGYSFNSLVGANGQAIFTSNSAFGSSVISEGTIPLLYKRNKSNSALVVGLGSSYKIGKNFITIDLRYMNGLTNLTNIENNYYDAAGSSAVSNSITQYRLTGDIFKLDNFAISFGFRYPLYKPRKLHKNGQQFEGLKFLKRQKNKNRTI
jgi:hypothetical protein